MNEALSTPPSGSPPPPRRKRRIGRRLLWGLGGFLLVLLILIAFLPALVSTRFGKERVLAVLRSRLGVPVEARDMAFSWTGEQRLEGLRLGQPQGFPQDSDLLSVKSAVLRRGLLGLLFRREAVTMEVDEPVANLRRNRDGRFNFEALLGEEKEKKRAPRETKKGKEGELPRITRRVDFALKSGTIDYQDDLMGASSRFSGIEALMNLDSGQARLAASARIGPSGGEAAARGGLLKVEALARGLEKSRSARDLEINGEGTAEDVDLRPYRGLLEKLFQVEPPETPLNGRFAFNTQDGVLHATTRLDAGFIRLSEATAEVPLEAGRPASLKLPWSVDLAGAQASLGARAGLPEGSRLAGKVEGSIQVSGPISVDTLVQKGKEALAGLAVEIEAKAQDLEVALPPGRAEAAAGAGAEAEGGKAALGRDAAPGRAGAGEGERPEPFTQKEMTLSLRASTGSSLDDLRIESAHLTADGVKADLSGSLGAPASGGPAAAGGPSRGGREAKGAPAGWPVEIVASLDASLAALVRPLASRLEGVEVGPESRARLSDLRLRGRLGGGGHWSRDLEGSGKLELSGEVKSRGLSVDQAQGELRLSGGEVVLLGGSASVNGGRLDAHQLAIGLEGSVPPFRLELEAKELEANYDLARLLAYAVPFLGFGDQKADFGGKLNASLSLEGQGWGPPDLKKSLKGKGSLRVLEGKIEASRFFNEAARLLGANLETVLFSEIGSDFDVGKARVACHKVYMNGKEGSPVRSLGLEGTTDFDGKIDFSVEMTPLAEAIGDRRIRSIFEQARKLLGRDVLPIRLQGTLSSPRLALDLDLQRSLPIPAPGDLPFPIPKIPGFKSTQGLRKASFEPPAPGNPAPGNPARP